MTTAILETERKLYLQAEAHVAEGTATEVMCTHIPGIEADKAKEVCS